MAKKALAVFLVGAIIIVVGAAIVNNILSDAEEERQAVEAQAVAATMVAQQTAVAATATAQATPTPPGITYIVQSGDTLLGIALEYDVELETIIAANQLEDEDFLDLGQEIVIPGVVKPTPVVVDPNNQAAVPIIEKPASVTINGLVESDFIIFPAGSRQNAQAIFNKGQELGRNPRSFSIIGDSTTEIPFFLARFDGGDYNLGDEYSYLESVIDNFAGSYGRDSITVRVGLHSYTLFDPTWADKNKCNANEGPLPCEMRLHNPSVVIIRLGSNDPDVPELFDESIRETVQYAIDNGVIPIIGTKADRFEGSNRNNDILRQIAADFQVPLWEYDFVAETMPGRGLDSDGVHMTTFYPHDYTQPEAYQRGHSLHNLTALMLLDTLWKEVILAADGS